MKKVAVLPALLAVFTITLSTAYALDITALAKAQVVLGKVSKVVDKYQDVQALINAGTVELDVAEPMAGTEGKFLLPFDANGTITQWAEKAITAQAGAQAGAMAGEKAGQALASKIPFGGLLAGATKRKSKEIGAVTAIGGWDFIRENSDRSFDNLTDYSVYLHSTFYGTAEYEQALASAMAIYPKLEKSHQSAIDRAYKDAKKRARALSRKK